MFNLLTLIRIYSLVILYSRLLHSPSVCLLVVHQSAAYDPNQPHSRQHRQVPHSDLSRYLYRQPNHNERPVRDTQEYKYDFERYNDIHPPNERQTKFQKYDQEKVSVVT